VRSRKAGNTGSDDDDMCGGARSAVGGGQVIGGHGAILPVRL
jgi:hypothetical protein